MKVKMDVSSKLLLFLAGFAVFWWLFTNCHSILVVSGDSMYPTLVDREICITHPMIAAIRGEVYVVKEPDSDVYAIKRLIGVPGDKVELVDGTTYCNGELVEEAPLDSWDNMSWVLGADEYLFLGDHRSVSYDGRHWSRPLRLTEILFEVDYIIYPLGQFGQEV